MRIYVMTTGALFILLTIAHIWRMVEERHLATDPWYVLITIATALFGIWAWLALRAARQSRNT